MDKPAINNLEDSVLEHLRKQGITIDPRQFSLTSSQLWECVYAARDKTKEEKTFEGFSEKSRREIEERTGGKLLESERPGEVHDPLFPVAIIDGSLLVYSRPNQCDKDKIGRVAALHKVDLADGTRTKYIEPMTSAELPDVFKDGHEILSYSLRGKYPIFAEGHTLHFMADNKLYSLDLENRTQREAYSFDKPVHLVGDSDGALFYVANLESGKKELGSIDIEKLKPSPVTEVSANEKLLFADFYEGNIILALQDFIKEKSYLKIVDSRGDIVRTQRLDGHLTNCYRNGDDLYMMFGADWVEESYGGWGGGYRPESRQARILDLEKMETRDAEKARMGETGLLDVEDNLVYLFRAGEGIFELDMDSRQGRWLSNPSLTKDNVSYRRQRISDVSHPEQGNKVVAVKTEATVNLTVPIQNLS